MMLRIGKLLKGSKGQGMTEYIIIVALIAIACLVMYKTFGGNVKGKVDEAGKAIESVQATTSE